MAPTVPAAVVPFSVSSTSNLPGMPEVFVTRVFSRTSMRDSASTAATSEAMLLASGSR